MNYTLGQKIEHYLFNTTEWISYDLAPGARYCYGIGLDTWDYVAVKQSEFDNWTDVGLAFLQNMLGSSISFQALIKKIEKANKVHDIRQVNWWYGRIFNLLIDFEPIPDDDYNSDDYSTKDKSISTPKLLEY